MLKLSTGLVIGLLFFGASAANASPITLKTDPVLSGASVIDFSSVPTGKYTSFTTDGVTFKANDGFAYVISNYSGSYGAVGQSIQNTYNGDGFGSITATFTDAVSFFAFNWGASDNQWTLSAYDGLGNLVESILPAITTGSNDGFTGIKSGSAIIKSFTLSGPASDYVFLDNLQFSESSGTGGPSAVPVPATLPLMLSGLGVLGFASRRKKRLA